MEVDYASILCCRGFCPFNACSVINLQFNQIDGRNQNIHIYNSSTMFNCWGRCPLYWTYDLRNTLPYPYLKFVD